MMQNVFVRLGIFAAYVFLFFYGLVLTKDTTAVNILGWLLVVGVPIAAFYYLKYIFKTETRPPALEAPKESPEVEDEENLNNGA